MNEVSSYKLTALMYILYCSLHLYRKRGLILIQVKIYKLSTIFVSVLRLQFVQNTHMLRHILRHYEFGYKNIYLFTYITHVMVTENRISCNRPDHAGKISVM